ncbi:hypothetical protein TL16_g04030 [Triparma laevis f. inornata]|uniref:Histone acetyltransferase n=2 Tax=Triparma laevis TaxID=1534972 RepID=A0A9W6ZS45_9STRA|nr:hypothetical protein TrLO_g7369 [Triparma laevis f. longispina]GMH64741.1 hypothetical protein TL16_g04030 [Triparma laevis f. inornata]
MGIEIINDDGVEIVFNGYDVVKIDHEVDLNSDDDDKNDDDSKEEEPELKRSLKFTQTHTYPLSKLQLLIIPSPPSSKKQKTEESPHSVITPSTSTSEDDPTPLSFSSLDTLILHLLPFLPPLSPPTPPQLTGITKTLFKLKNLSHFNSLQHMSISLIENGSSIDPENCEGGNWDIYYYLINSSIIGYATVFNFKSLNGTIARICQVIIIEPSKGYGLNFLHSLMSHFENDESVKEVNVEDPCPMFSRLRDVVDYFGGFNKITGKQKKRIEMFRMVTNEGMEKCKVKVKRYLINHVLNCAGAKKEEILKELKRVWEDERAEIVKVVGRIERERSRHEESYAC